MLNDSQTGAFVQLLAGHQSDIYLFVRSLILDADQAADIVGEVNLTVWDRRDQFAIGTDFLAWAFRIARHKVQEWCARSRRRRAVFSEEMLLELAEFAERQAEAPSQRLEDLRHCMNKLPPEDRELVLRRYAPGASVQQIAADAGQPVQWVYKAVSRIRAALAYCIARQMTLRQREAHG
jgi:RNA polymerase sigma-70 factor (ECF subfamily)